MKFRNPQFALLWLGQIFCQLAERFLIFILVLLIYERTQSNAGVAYVGITFGIPAILLGAFAGVLVDIWDHKWTLFFVNFFRAVVMTFLFLLYPFHHSLSVLLIFAFATAILQQLFIPAETATIPQIVSSRSLVTANAIFISTFYAIGIIGMGLGSFLDPFFSSRHAYFGLIAAFFAISALFLFLMPYKAQHVQFQTRKNLLVELWEGFQFAFLEYRIRQLMIATLIISTVFSSLTILGIGFADKVLKIGAENFGYLAVIGGLGMFVGIVMLNFLKNKLSLFRLINIGFIGGGLSLLFFAGSPYFLSDVKVVVVFTALMVAGFFLAWIVIPIQTGLQQLTTHSFRGRVLGIQNMLLNFSLTLPVWWLGKLADQYGIQEIFLGLSVVVLLQGLIMIKQIPHLEKTVS